MRTFTQNQSRPEEQVSGCLTRFKTETRGLHHPPRPAMIQTKLAISQPGDAYEQEANHVSESVMHMSKPRPDARACCGGNPKYHCGQPGSKQEDFDISPAGPRSLGQTEVPPVVHEVLRSPGQPLDPATRLFMEPRFGHDFARVRVHTNSRAAESAAAVDALAYTVGNHIVFGTGQHGRGSFHDQRLLAHELAHVVQHNGGRTLHDESDGKHHVSDAPANMLCRDGPATEAERKKQETQKNEDAKKDTVEQHLKQQRIVSDLLDKARKIQPDSKKGLRDPDNLFRNSVGMLDGGKLTLTVLSPVHYSPDVHFDSRFRFDSKGHAAIGGDYPANPKVRDAGMVDDKSSAFGQLKPDPVPFSIQTLPEKVERAPGETSKPAEPAPAKTSSQPRAATPFLPGEILLFTRGLTITEEGFKNTFVHEVQHVADLSPRLAIATNVDELLDAYKSEFRAFWIQPPLPPQKGIGTQSLDVLPEPTKRPDNSKTVDASKPEDCSLCSTPPAGQKAFEEHKTDMQNARQQAIFWYIMSHYKDQKYDCCYVYNKQFHTEVNKFANPESLNLINSDRLMNLNLEVQKLNKSMTLAEVNSTNFTTLLTQLEVFDWVFLDDRTMSKPFWEALKAAAPGFLHTGVGALAKKGKKNPVSVADVNKALSGK
jgi:hypothetical protein